MCGLLVGVGAFFWIRGRREPPPSAALNILLVTIDTLRADRVGRGLTPAIDALADVGARFDNARTVAPLTLPAHVSIMTGLLPPAHGVRVNGVVFEAATPTLARVLKDAGYRTAGFVGAYVLNRRFGLSDGFDVYDDRVPRDASGSARLEAERRGGEVTDAALAWLQSVPEPFFAWIHLYDPHAPYDPPAEFLAKGGGHAYDGEVAYADAQVGRLVEALRNRRLTDRTAIAVVGDHGEGLGDHGEQTHGMLAYDSTLRVPLVLVAPGWTTRARVAGPVSIVDIPATLLRLARLRPPEAMADWFLLSAADRDVYAETEYPRSAGWQPLAAVAERQWKLILSSEPELYDVAADPAETHNRAAERTALVDGMSRRVRELSRPPAGASAAAVDPAAAERLRALGYVSGTPAAPSAGAPNPARAIGHWTAFERALGQVNAGRARDAVPALAGLVERFPASPVFQTTYGRALMESGNARRALEVYRAAVRRTTADVSLFHDMAVAARAAGEAGEAIRAEQAALALEPGNAAALNGVGLLHADAGRAKDAAAAFERATNADPSNASYWANLGNARRATNDLTGAEAAYRRALEADPSHPDAANGLGVLLVQRGSPADAVRWFELALQRAPDFHEARLNLGIAYQESGNKARAAETYRELLATAPPSATRERRAAGELLGALR